MTRILSTQAAGIKGKEIKGGFSTTHQFSPETEELRSTKGTLFILVTVQADMAQRLAQSFCQSFQEAYYASSVGSNLATLEGALAHSLKSVEQDSSAPSLINVVAAVLWGEVLYLVKTAGTEVVFQRGDAFKVLKFEKTASGSVKEGDIVFLTNKKFLESVEIEKFSQDKTEFREYLNEVEEQVSSAEGAAALAFKIYLEEHQDKSSEVIEARDTSKFEIGSLIENLRSGSAQAASLITSQLKPAVGSLRNEALKILNWVWNKIAEPWKARELGHIEDPAKRRRARSIQIAGVLIILLVLSIAGALVHRTNSAKVAEFNKKLASIEAEISDAESLNSIDPTGAKKTLAQIREDLGKAQETEIKSNKLNSLQARFESLEKAVNKAYQTTLGSFYSFSSDTNLSTLLVVGNTLVALDRNQSRLFAVDLSTKEEKEVGRKVGLNTVASFENVLYLQTALSIEKLDLGSGTTTNLAGASSGWGKIVGAATYQSNLYLLDQEKKQVWKYLGNGTSLSAPQNYFRGNPDLGTSSAIAIDGSVWIGSKNGALLNFLTGKKQNFEINGLDTPFGEIAGLYTSASSNNIFVLDKGGKRIVILAKSGNYVSQYKSDDLGNASSFTVDETHKKIYAAIGSNIKVFNYK